MTTLELEKIVTFKNIVVAVDFSDASKQAVECAAAIASGSDAQVFVLHVMPPEPRLPIPPSPLPAGLDWDFPEAKANLGALVSPQSFDHVHHEEILGRGPVWDVVSDVLQKKKADLLVVGTHGRTGLTKLILGSVAEELFRRCACPVLTVGPLAAPTRQIRRVCLRRTLDSHPSKPCPMRWILPIVPRENSFCCI